VPQLDGSPYLESQSRSRARRFAAHRARRRRWSLRAILLVVVACLSLTAGGALASTSSRPHLSRATVKKVQRALDITADGVYGRQTRRAVRRFQRAHGLEADGIAGPQTLAALGIRKTRSRALDDTPPADSQTELAKIAQCESGGDPTAVSPDGQYRGKYQFTRATWRHLGGSGDPADASEALQDKLALKLYRARGTDPWPSCSQAG
jgi:Transglycosylase-like domain/Putative peptidoglycan binding domain